MMRIAAAMLGLLLSTTAVAGTRVGLESASPESVGIA